MSGYSVVVIPQIIVGIISTPIKWLLIVFHFMQSVPIIVLVSSVMSPVIPL